MAVTFSGGLSLSFEGYGRERAIDVKKGDQWQTSQLTEMEAAPSSAYSQLRALEWLVGTWEDKAGATILATHF